MASWEEGSCDLKFVDSKASKEFNCCSCKSLAVQPRLNPSCGHHYCRPCTEKLVNKGRPCPRCRADITSPVSDLYFERQMKQLKVRCFNYKNVCPWIGKLAELQNHLDRCRAVPGKWARQKDYEIAVLTKRLESAERLSRVAEERSQIAEEKTQATEEKIERLKKQLASPAAIATPEFVMTKFEDCRDKKRSWYSPPFYSHIGGYKMCLQVDANGVGIGAGTHVSVFVRLMQGEDDDHLKWPFRGEITVKLLSHRALGGNVEHTIVVDSSTPDTFAGRVIGRQYSGKEWGIHEFIAHSDLPYNPAKSTEYLNNDSLTFCVTKVLSA